MKFFLRLPLFLILYICFFNISYGQISELQSQLESPQIMRFLFESCPEDQKKFISYNLKFNAMRDEIREEKDSKKKKEIENKSYELLEKSMTEFVNKVNEEGLQNWVGYVKDFNGLNLTIFLNEKSNRLERNFNMLFNMSLQNKNFKPQVAEKLKTFNLSRGEIVKFSLNPLKLNYSLKLIDSRPKSMELKFNNPKDNSEQKVVFFKILSSKGDFWVLEQTNIKSIDKFNPKSLPISTNKNKKNK